MSVVPLRLALDPLLPSRTPEGLDGRFLYGFRLRLPDGPVIKPRDPLLAAYGARAVSLETCSEHDESLQADGFDPGRRVRFVPEQFDPVEPDGIGVWDAECVRQAGTVPARHGGVVRPRYSTVSSRAGSWSARTGP